jgi:hypothetical protein
MVWLLLAVLVVAGCATPAQSTPNPTVEALNARVEALQQQLATVQPVTLTRPPVPTMLSTATAEPLPEIVVAASFEETEEPTPEPSATSVPTATSRPTLFPTRTPRVITDADAAPCRLGQIKANRNSRIYHVPGGGSYSQTKANVVCFDTEAEAETAGYRRARN